MNNLTKVNGVRVRYWNPKRYTKFRYITYGPRRNNFGDMLGPALVEALTADHTHASSLGRRGKLLAVGSILHFAKNGDVVWGTGRNGKIGDHWHRFDRLDVRAVRGPLTAKFLADRGISVPSVFGDPGLLVPQLFPDLVRRSKVRDLLIVPNLHDESRVPPGLRMHMISPTDPWEECVRAIAESGFVVSSSLHGKVIADALGIPSRLVRSVGETSWFKYDDYFLGTGRTPEVPAASFEVAVREAPAAADLAQHWSHEPLLAAFPRDLWR